jgi:hypothetical protein
VECRGGGPIIQSRLSPATGRDSVGEVVNVGCSSQLRSLCTNEVDAALGHPIVQ